MDSALKTRITADMKLAMKAKDSERLVVIRLILSAIKQQEVDERITLDDQQIISILAKMCKQRRESISCFTKGERPDLAAKEQFELDILASYLPTPLSQSEISELITTAIAETNAASMKDMGKVMAFLKPKLQGRANLSEITNQIKTLLNKGN